MTFPWKLNGISKENKWKIIIIIFFINLINQIYFVMIYSNCLKLLFMIKAYFKFLGDYYICKILGILFIQNDYGK